MGSSFRADETILSWLLDGRPVPAPYQYVRNDGHSSRTEESHKIYSPFLHHDSYRQHDSGLLYQQTRSNTFSQPVHRGIGDTPLVPGTRCSDQSVIFQANSTSWQTTSRGWTDLSKWNGLWINQLRIPYSKCSIIPMWTGLRHDSITNSHCMYLQFLTVMP